MKRILILGKQGQVSHYLQQTVPDWVELTVAGSDELDLRQTDKIYPFLEKLNCDLIINPAAYTAVDAAETESEQAFAINRDAVGEIGRFAKHSNTPLVHFSTDYVFDGTGSSAYSEADLPNPNGVYGLSKYEGEQQLIKQKAPALVLRTAWVYSNHGRNFFNTMLALASSRKELSVVADQKGAPTYAGAIASACWTLVEHIKKYGWQAELAGVYHFSCQGHTSWYEFASQIFAKAKLNIVTHPIKTSDYPTPAKRPAFSVLDNSKLKRVFNIALPDWQLALDLCIAERERIK